MTEQEQAATTEQEIQRLDEEEARRPHWRKAGVGPSAEIVYVDEEGKPRFPDTPPYVYPSAEQAKRARSGKTVYADEGSAGGEIPATDPARAKAEELGVDIAEVGGTGANGNVKVEDVEAHAREAAKGGTPPEPDPFADMENGRAFWAIDTSGRVVYVDEDDAWFVHGDRGYVAPSDEDLARLDAGERVYASEDEG